jgi:GTPase SAR1 family protein
MEEESKIPNVKQLIAVIFFGVPGIGKSTLIKKFLQDPEIDKYVIDIVSSDQIKAKCIKDFLEKNPSASQDEAFQKTAKPYRTDFISAIGLLLFQNSD